MPTVNVEAAELSARWAELFALAQAGTEIIVTEAGRPSPDSSRWSKASLASPACTREPL